MNPEFRTALDFGDANKSFFLILVHTVDGFFRVLLECAGELNKPVQRFAIVSGYSEDATSYGDFTELDANVEVFNVDSSNFSVEKFAKIVQIFLQKCFIWVVNVNNFLT